MATLGQYKGIDINSGTDSEISAQMAAVDAQKKAQNFNGVITPDSLTQTNPLTVPNIQKQTSSLAGAGVQSFVDANKEIQQGLQEKQKTLSEQTSTQETSLTGYIKKLLGKGEEQAALESQQGIPDKTQALNDITNEMNTKSLQFRREQEAILNTPGITKEQANSQIAEISRRNNQELADLAIRQSVASNNLKATQDLINRKIDLEYGDLKDVIAYQMNFLKENKDQLSQNEQNQLNLKIKENETDLQTAQKDAELKAKAISDVLSSGNSIPDSVMQQILNGTGSQAYTILAQNGISTTNKLDEAYKLAQIRKIESDMSSNGTSDPSGIIAYAQQYASTGTIPTGLPKGTFGIVSQIAKELPKDSGTIVDKNTGIKSGKLSSTQIDGISTLYDIYKKTNQLRDLEKEKTRGLVGGVAGATVFSASDTQKYLDLRQEIIDLLARARTGAALTASEEKFYAEQLPGRISNIFGLGKNPQKRIDNFQSKIEGTLNTKLNANGLSIYGFSKVKPSGADKEYTVGDIIEGEDGTKGRINSDGSITIIQ